MMKDIKNKLLEMLICPQCKKNLNVEAEGAVCETCRLLYPFNHGEPAMLAESAIPLDSDELVN